MGANARSRAETPRARHLRVKYGITEGQYDGLNAYGGGNCWVCLRPPKEGRRLQVDHDHKTGEIRGLLCWRCNRYIHYWMDEEWLRSAALYVGRRTLEDGSNGDYTGLFVPERKRKRKKLTKD